MRRLILVPAVLAAFLGWGVPTGGDIAEARSLFEKLFPRTAARRRARIAAERARIKAARRERQRLIDRRRAQAKVKKRKVNRQARRASLAAVSAASANRFLVYRPDRITRVRTAKFSRSLAKKAAARAAARRDRMETLRQDRIGRMAIKTAAVAIAAQPFDMLSAAPHLLQVKVMADTPVAKALRAHYLSDPRFLWLDDEGRATDEARAMVALFADAAAEGLEPAHYAVPDLPNAPLVLAGIDVVDGEAWRDRLTFELTMSARALRYLRDARHGRVIPSRISTYHDFGRNKADERKLLAEIAKSDDRVALLRSAHPRQAQYAALRSALAEERLGTAARSEPVVVPKGTFLKPGWSSEHMSEIVRGVSLKGSATLKETHAATLAAYDGGDKYTEALAALVRDFQREKGLGADGIIGRKTLAQLADGPKVDRTRALTLAMERLRWHPDEFGRRHVFINQPEFRARYVVDGEERLGMNVVVGKPGNQTNFFHDEIEYVEFNPYWGVPLSIKRNEFLPKLRRDASWLDRNGYELTDGRGRIRSSSAIDWWSVDESFPFDVRQPPGPRNALGRLKIMFPNRHSIYMHDTPSKKLFARPVRAYSHGCVRLADPQAMAAAVLGKSENFVQGRIKRGTNNATRLKTKVPVYVSYFTAWPKADGSIGYYSDIYKRDRALETALARASEERMQDEDI